jgi:hypothetical protein
MANRSGAAVVEKSTTEPGRPPMNTEATFETEAMLLRAVPLMPFAINGHLLLHEGRLQFARRNGRTDFDVAVTDVRDVGTWGKYVLRLDLAHGPSRRLVIGDRQRVVHLHGAGDLLGAAVTAAQLPGARARDAVNRDLVQQWIQLLRPMIESAAA